MALSRFGTDPFFSSNLGRDPLDDFFIGSSLMPWTGQQGGQLAMRGQQQPLLPPMHMDVKETDAGFEITADAPGLTKDDINIEFEDGLLRIQAERKEEKREENDRWHVNERRWGTVSRSVRLPKTADAANIAAKYENGVLKVKVGKQAEAARKAIRVE